ncbi:MAG: TRL-like family protein [Planctomycetota bacterium]
MRRLALLLIVPWLTACNLTFEAPVIPPTGFAYSSIRAPLDTDLDETELGDKVGRATTRVVLGLVSWGDASIEAAAKEAGITTLRHADYEYDNILFFYQRFTVIVYGD